MTATESMVERVKAAILDVLLVDDRDGIANPDEVARAAIEAMKPEFQRCYELGLAHGSADAGEVVGPPVEAGGVRSMMAALAPTTTERPT